MLYLELLAAFNTQWSVCASLTLYREAADRAQTFTTTDTINSQ